METSNIDLMNWNLFSILLEFLVDFSTKSTISFEENKKPVKSIYCAQRSSCKIFV